MIRFRYLFVYFSVIFNFINFIQTVPNGYLVAASYDPLSSSNSLFKIDPMSGNFTVLTPLTNYKAYDVTYDFIRKIFYVFGSEATAEKESAPSVAIVNLFNGTIQYRTITTERYGDICGLRVDSSTGNLYSVQMDGLLENPISIIQINTTHFIAKQWVNITKATGVQSDSMAIFSNETDHQYFVTVPYSSDYLVGIDVIKRKIISEITN
jgi:hypothetical protein